MASSTPKHCSHCLQNGACASVGGQALQVASPPKDHEPTALIHTTALVEVDLTSEQEPVAVDALPANRTIQFGAPLRGPLGRLRCSLTVDEYMSALGRAHSRRIV